MISLCIGLMFVSFFTLVQPIFVYQADAFVSSFPSSFHLDIFDEYNDPVTQQEEYQDPHLSLVQVIQKNGHVVRKKTSLPQQRNQVSSDRQVVITAYSSTQDQTDDTPCLTANGFDLFEHDFEDIVASNFLPLGTRVRIPALFGERVFSVQDRMHPRHHYRVDLWMKTREKAKQFGVKRASIEVVSDAVALKK